jgi:Ca2+-binding EF-hand superfamily protein
MLQKHLFFGTLALCSLMLGTLPMSDARSAPPASTDIGSSDKDSDQTLDLAEVKAAASAHFDKLDKDADGSLDHKELQGIIGPGMFKAADADNDGTLSKDEYLALVEKLFAQADVDHDGTLDVKEINSKSAHTLRRLIR